MRLEISFNICRICLQNNDDDMSAIYEPITQEKEGDTAEYLYQHIELCGGIQVLTNPELPNKICRKCRLILNIAHKFRKICRSSDRYLREFLSISTDDFKNNSIIVENNQNVQCTEFLQESNTETSPDVTSTVGEVLEKAGHKIADESQSAINFEEIDEYTELFLYDEDNDQDSNVPESENNNSSDVINTSENKDIKPLEINTLRRSNRMRKTLDITSDGAAVIRVKSNQLLKPEKQVHICDICGNSYNRKYALDAHMRRHRNEKPFECEICQKAFHLNFQLTRHIRKHTGARPYTCKYCHRNFADRSTMVKHERIHRNERPYTCETCGKSFTYSNVLKVHMLTHTGEKPFNCGICGKRFARAHHLRAHLETLQHQNDPRSKTLLKQIKREENRFQAEEY